MYYIFDDLGNLKFKTTDESYAQAWCEHHDTFYLEDSELTIEQIRRKRLN